MLLLNISLVTFLIFLQNCSSEITEIKHCDEFTCTDGTCLSENVVCDGFFDCPDGFDETHCKLFFVEN